MNSKAEQSERRAFSPGVRRGTASSLIFALLNSIFYALFPLCRSVVTCTLEADRSVRSDNPVLRNSDHLEGVRGIGIRRQNWKAQLVLLQEGIDEAGIVVEV